MVSFEEYQNDLPMLVEAGLIAIKQGDEDSARKLFGGVAVINPEHSAINIGYALIALHKMELETAEEKFLQALEKDANNFQVKAFLSFTYVLWAIEEKDKDKQLHYLKRSTELSQEVIQNSDVPTTIELAQSILEWERQLQEKATARGPMS